MVAFAKETPVVIEIIILLPRAYSLRPQSTLWHFDIWASLMLAHGTRLRGDLALLGRFSADIDRDCWRGAITLLRVGDAHSEPVEDPAEDAPPLSSPGLWLTLSVPLSLLMVGLVVRMRGVGGCWRAQETSFQLEACLA